MAALVGFDLIEGDATVTAPFAAGDTLLSVSVPARTVIAGIDLTVSDLDSNAAPTITLNVGDAGDVDRFVAASTLAQDGGDLEYRPAAASWYLYTTASAVTFRVGTDAATDASGTISAVLYTYPGVDISTAIAQTLARLGVIAEGETPRAEYANEASLALAEVHEFARYKSFAARQDLAWPLALIPVFAVRAYATMAAYRLRDTFGLPAQRKAMLDQMAQLAERDLRAMTRKAYDETPVSLEPYDDTTTTDYGTAI